MGAIVTPARPATADPAGMDSARATQVVVAAAIALLALRLPWIELDPRGPLRGKDLASTSDLYVLLVLLATAGALWASRNRSGIWLVPAALHLGLSLWLFGTVLLLEFVGSTIPTANLPRFVGRELVQAGSGPGLWLAATATLGGGLTALSDRLVWRPRRRSLTADPMGAAGTLLAMAGIFGLVVGRWWPWVGVAAHRSTVEAEGRALPWIGPLTALGAWTLAVALGADIALRRFASTCVVALVAWAWNLLALVVLGGRGVAAGLLARAPHVRGVAGRVVATDPTIQVGRGLWITLASSFVVILGTTCRCAPRLLRRR